MLRAPSDTFGCLRIPSEIHLHSSSSLCDGQRSVTFDDVPFATARDSQTRPGPPPTCGAAEIDLSGTGFGVHLDEFCARGCSAWGVLVVPLDASVAAKWSAAERLEHVSRTPIQQRLALRGGGYAGRLTPTADLTRDELAHGHDNDHEGRNGGWVLQLHFHALDGGGDGGGPPPPAIEEGPRTSLYAPFLKPVDAQGSLAQSLTHPVHEWRAEPFVEARTLGNDGRPYVPVSRPAPIMVGWPE